MIENEGGLLMSAICITSILLCKSSCSSSPSENGERPMGLSLSPLNSIYRKRNTTPHFKAQRWDVVIL